MTISTLILILATVLASAIAQLALKLGMSNPAIGLAAQNGGRALVLAVAGSPLVWAGLTIYGAGVLAWLYVLSKVDLSCQLHRRHAVRHLPAAGNREPDADGRYGADRAGLYPCRPLLRRLIVSRQIRRCGRIRAGARRREA
jgi:hypothetical protein